MTVIAEPPMPENVIAKHEAGQLTQTGLAGSLEQLVIEHQHCTARVSLYGGHVLAWQPKGEQEVFWLSKSPSYQAGKAIRGGVPLCWPWFGGWLGTQPEAAKAGNHGFARTVLWQLANHVIDDKSVTIELVWQGSQQHPVWPYHAKVTQKLKFGQTFEQQFIVENLASEAFEFTGALHSYFAVSSPAQVTAPALDNVLFDCKLTGNQQQREVLSNLVGPLDRIYHSQAEMALIDTGFGRVIRIAPQNVKQWVLWNPGQAVAQGMADVHQGGEQEYVCLEAANTQWLTVEAGQSLSFGQVISVAPL
ncbi:D-hexose-6-phosphate mutarotase [Thalassotalea euphylliae]|uniref:Putative glucose-6-phosphate 1-epimerase n=1 Tax=Thalassotalea euphylliae TaxID=1655234 RepID=A0A3E0TPE0_9GAMM|nr:D-hexose-6-phosphate mutarotase [Thalassotalea euphylliae]REL26419.1 D-hexose-6-phosphate mutarotase [Thalassotalea euphylliae]